MAASEQGPSVPHGRPWKRRRGRRVHRLMTCHPGCPRQRLKRGERWRERVLRAVPLMNPCDSATAISRSQSQSALPPVARHRWSFAPPPPLLPTSPLLSLFSSHLFFFSSPLCFLFLHEWCLRSTFSSRSIVSAWVQTPFYVFIRCLPHLRLYCDLVEQQIVIG